MLRQNDIVHLLQRNKTLPAPLSPQDPAPTAAGVQRPTLLLDTSVIIDGRISDVADTGFLLGKLLSPALCSTNCSTLPTLPTPCAATAGAAASKCSTGCNKTLPSASSSSIIDPTDAQQVDDKLISLARQTRRRRPHQRLQPESRRPAPGRQILNINELANAVKSVFLPGEEMPIKIIQVGKEIGQGVGYLEDGTMVVVENGRQYLNQEVLVQVTKVLQTNAGRLVFAVPEVAFRPEPTIRMSSHGIYGSTHLLTR